METMHSLLKRQLKRHFGDEFRIPAEMRAFLNGVNEAYREFDADREMLERSLELSSQELIDANSEMRAVFQAIPDLVFRLDLQGVILDVKAGAAGDLMIRREDLIGKRIQDTPLLEVAAQFSVAIQRVVAENVPVSVEYSAVLQGQESHYEARLVPLAGKQIVVIIRNITERKQSLRLLGAAVEHSTESIVITDADLDLPGPRIVFVNPAFTRMTGYTAGEVLGKTPRLLQGPHSDRATLQRLRATLERGETFSGESVNYRKDGTEFIMEWQIAPIHNASGKIMHFVAVQHDITERKRAEEALRTSENQFHTLAKVSPAGIFRTDASGLATYWNEKLCRITGMTVEEALGTGWTQGIHPDDRQRVFAGWERCVKERLPFKMQYRFIHKDGSVTWTIGEADSIVDEAGGITGHVGTITDITELKLAEEKLAHEQARLRFVFESMPVGAALARHYPDGRLERIINDAHLRICGLTREQDQIPGIYKQITHPEDFARQAELGRQFDDDRAGGFSMEKRYVRLDGELVWVLYSFQRHNYADGSFDRLTTVVDITEFKRTEAALRESQALYHSLVEQLPAGIFRKDAAGRYIFVNPRYCQFKRTAAENILGRTPQEVADWESKNLTTMWHQEQALQGSRHHEQIMQTGRPIELEETTPCPDGQLLYLHVVKSAVFGADNKIIGSQGILLDVTELKRTEAALVETSALLETLLQNTTDHIYFKDLESRFVHFSQSMPKHFQLARPEELKGKNDFDFFTEEHARPAFAAEQEIIRTGQPIFNLEEKETHADGRVSWVLTSKMPWRDKTGTVIGTFGISKDITARKQAEEALRLSEERSRSIIESAHDAFVGIDARGRIAHWNRQAEMIFGWPRADVTGRFLHETIIPEKYREGHLRGMRHLQATGEGPVLNKRIELTALRRNGEEFPVEMTIWALQRGAETTYNAFIRDITERKQAEEALQLLRDQHALILNALGEGVHSLDLNGQIVFENPAAAAMFGREINDLIGKPAHATIHHTRPDGTPYPQSECPVHATLKDGLVRHVRDEVFWRKDGTSFPVEYVTTPLRDKTGKTVGTTVVFTDITERKQVEARLFEAQKMETVGKLAGGVAHEFNSILTAIIGRSELLLVDLPAGSPLAESATEITQAACRAAALTRQLLAYGRKQFLQPEILDLNRVVAGMEAIFRNLMGGKVALQFIPAADLQLVKVDAGQIDQVIINLVMNARDAMPNGGKLMLETANVAFDPESVGRYPELKPGGYVMLAITDTGIGMSEEVKARAFEPFFTTKDIGQGTGLGLSTCYGIIKQSGGHISLYSEPGRGTTFKIYLPQVPVPAKISDPPSAAPDLPRGTETILLVEDDSALRSMAATLLERLGYVVLTAANGIEALNLKQQPATGHIDLLFTDVVMPHMSGRELADRVQALYPHTKILFTSAYTENAIAYQGVLDKGVVLLQKPFSPSALAHKVREVLDQPSATNRTNTS